MPRYFFDIHDDIDVIDDEGQDLPDLNAARREAVRGLAEAAKDMFPESGATEKTLVIHVRTEYGRVLTARLTFSVD